VYIPAEAMALSCEEASALVYGCSMAAVCHSRNTGLDSVLSANVI